MGYMPLEFYGPNHAWSVSLNPQKYNVPNEADCDAKIFPVDADGKKTGDELKLNVKSVSRFGSGVPLCLIFRPDKSAVAAGKRYLVEITGVQLKSGGAAAISYPVEFITLAAGK
jgi:hypothetical protein